MAFSTLDVIKTNDITVLDDENNKYEGKSVIIQYPGYRILIIDTGLLEKHRKPNILSTIDVIIVLQWSSTVQLSLNNLFNEIANKNLLFEKCTCLILPMIGQFKHVKFNSIQHKSIKSSLLKNDEIKEMIWLHIALKLGLTVLQVCNGNKFWTRFQYTQSMSLFASEKLYLNLYNNSQSIQKTKYNSEFLKRSLLLYEKFGVGQLKILPIPTGYVANHSSSYSVLFTWIPYETELSNIIEHHKNYVKVFFYSVTLDSKKASDSVNETQLVHHQIEIEQKLNNEAITITKSLIQQLTRYVGMNCSINKKGSNEHDVTYSQSKITRSKTFTSGLNPLKRTIYTNGVRSTTNPILRKNREQKYENDVVKSPEDNQKHKNGIKQVTFSETVKFVSTEDFVKKVTMKSSVNVNRSVTPEILPWPMVRGISTQTPLPPQTTVVNTNTTNATITTNIPESPVIVSNEKNNDEFFLQSIEECSSEGKTETLLNHCSKKKVMNSHNWSGFDQTVVFTEHSKDSLFNVTNDNLNPMAIFQNNHGIHTDSFHSNSENFMNEELKQQDHSFTSTKNAQRGYVTKKHQKCATSDSVSSQCFIEPSLVVPTGIRRRGPKKKPDSQERVVRMKMRRARANARERSRMHGLNSALDALRQHIPSALIGGYISFDLDKKDDTTICTTHNDQRQNESNKLFSKNHRTNSPINQMNSNNNVNNFHQFGQKLSKIETLRLACNYIGLLASILNDIHFESITDIIKYLCHGLSQITTNQIAAALQSDPSRLMKHQVSGSNENHLLCDNSYKSSSASSSPTDDDVSYTEKIQQNVIRSSLLRNKLSDERIVNHLDYQSNNVSLTIPTNQSTSISNFNQSMGNCSSNCTELLKSQNYLLNNKLYEFENVYKYEQYEMNECDLTFPYFPTNYDDENIGNSQPNESINHENWISKTKLQLHSNEEINFINPLETDNSINISVDSEEPILNLDFDLKSCSYYYHHHLNGHYYDSY